MTDSESEEKYYKQAVGGTIPEAYTPAKGGLLPKREPSGSWVSWENTMCNPLAPARMQTQSAWADGYASAKKDERVIDKSMAKRIATQLGWEPKREWVGFTQEEHQSAIWADGSFGAGFLHAEKLLKEKNT